VRSPAVLLAILVGLALTAAQAAAKPTLRFGAAAVPVPGYPETGDIYGAGAAVKVEYLISGNEYERSPAPMTGLTLGLPSGVKLDNKGWPTCPQLVLEPTGAGPEHCPPGSRAGPVGLAQAFVTLGAERVKEEATVESFNAPGGALEFFMRGHSPVALEILSTGHYRHLSGAAEFGPELAAEIPLVESLPGAPYASVESVNVTTGSARGPKSANKATYYLRLPRTCPAQGWLFTGSVTLAGIAGLPRQTLTASSRAPCPSRALAEAAEPQTEVPGTGGAIVAPSNKVCVSRRHFTLHVRHLRGLVYRRVTVELDGRQLRVLRGPRISANVDLRGLPKGYYTVRISVLTTTGHTISGTRSYHTCASKPIPPKGKARL
jgi:hypothetical protein